MERLPRHRPLSTKNGIPQTIHYYYQNRRMDSSRAQNVINGRAVNNMLMELHTQIGRESISEAITQQHLLPHIVLLPLWYL